jgi:acetyltransferase-like isoleucine patch superfamily enzyme
VTATSLFDRFLRRLLRPAVESVAREILDTDFLYRFHVHGEPDRLHIHPTAVVNDALFNVSGGEITIGEHAFFGHGVSILTGTHDTEKFGRERQLAFPKAGRDVTIGTGAWIASHVIILGPCTIGDHAVVGAGSLVTRDVPPYTIVAGHPARSVRSIPHRSG